MFAVSATTQKIQFKLSGAVATNQVYSVGAYAPLTTATQTVDLTTFRVVSNNATPVDVVPAPTGGVPHQLKSWSTVNIDTAPITGTLQLVDSSGSVTAIIVKVTLAVGDILLYAGGDNWMVLDSNGALKTVLAAPFTSMTSGTNTQMAAVVGSGASILYSGTGIIDASKLAGIAAATYGKGGFGIVVDGGGAVISTGSRGNYVIPYDCTIVGWTVLADDGNSGAIQFDVWRDTYANFPPDVTDTITASDKPKITATGNKGQNTNASTWSVTCSAGDIIRYNVDSVTTLTRAVLFINTIRR